ncbi:hypothetical protein K2173_008011 [Erythroxylum novogranatense]|uniref:Uncharacterized protein n=1 Tax=Erythroxylum novogranatense TaxID=1862640 RepID=A0AAV8T7A2_9ROSI|nr:hypothetical protein K2173_008011 [Erythroxylum novogranatense]
MSRRPAMHPSCRYIGDGGGGAGLFAFKSRSQPSPYLSIALIVLGAILVFTYMYNGSGGSGINVVVSRITGDFSCTAEVMRAIPVLKKAYGDSMHKVLHVGPDTCAVVSRLLTEEETEAWGVEPYDIEDADRICNALVRKALVRVADIKFPLPYRQKSFHLVIISDALDYLSPRYLNKTLPELATLSTEGLVIFTGVPGHHKAKTSQVSRFGRATGPKNPALVSIWLLSLNFCLPSPVDRNKIYYPSQNRRTGTYYPYLPTF